MLNKPHSPKVLLLVNSCQLIVNNYTNKNILGRINYLPKLVINIILTNIVPEKNYTKSNHNLQLLCFLAINLKHVFSCASSGCLPKQTQSHNHCICSVFPQCVLSYVASNRLPKRMHTHTGCICLASLHYVLSNVSSNGRPERMHSHTGCICLTFL